MVFGDNNTITTQIQRESPLSHESLKKQGPSQGLLNRDSDLVKVRPYSRDDIRGFVLQNPKVDLDRLKKHCSLGTAI